MKCIQYGNIIIQMERGALRDRRKEEEEEEEEFLKCKASTHKSLASFFPRNREQKNGRCRHEHQTNKDIICMQTQ